MIYADWKHAETPEPGTVVVREGHGGDWRQHDGKPVDNDAGVFVGTIVEVVDGVARIKPAENDDAEIVLEPTPLESES